MNRNTSSRLIFCLAIFLSLPASGQALYTIENIGSFPGDFGNTPADINSMGQVVGSSFRSPQNAAYLWDPVTGLTDIGTLPGAQGADATGINDGGFVVGGSLGGTPLSFLWVPPAGPMVTLGLLPSLSTASANAISNTDAVIGNAFPGPVPFAFNRAGSGVLESVIDTLGGLTLRAVNDISDTDSVVGSTADETAYFMALGSPAQALGRLRPTDTFSVAEAVNNSGQVAGRSGEVGDVRGFIWENGIGLQDLGTLGPGTEQVFVADINNAGQIVGSDVDGFTSRAFVWQAGTGMLDLNDLIDPNEPLGAVVNLDNALGINDAGQIVVNGLFNGILQSFVLTPSASGPPPAAIAVTFSGATIAVSDTSGGAATYSGVGLGDVMNGSVIVGASENGSAFLPPADYQFPSSTFFAQISDGQTLTSTQDSARNMEVSFEDNRVATSDDVALFNALLGTSLPPGTLFDAIQVETDTVNGNRRLETGLSYISLDTTLITDTSYQFLPNLADVDLVLYFVDEEIDDVDVYNALGLVSAQSYAAIGVDTDNDGIADISDNCTLVPNGVLLPDDGGNSQRDTNGDGFGNVCDPDLNNDNIVNVVDLGLLRQVFFQADDDADLNGDGIVNVVDLGILRAQFFAPPGPAGLVSF
ncbi:MAG: hypothetical protein AB8G17_14000 [Gammaproteobacteria bacterium]